MLVYYAVRYLWQAAAADLDPESLLFTHAVQVVQHCIQSPGPSGWNLPHGPLSWQFHDWTLALSF